MGFQLKLFFIRRQKCPMPVKTDVHVPPPANSHQPGLNRSLLYNGSRFQGHQKSKGNCYDVEVVLQVKLFHTFQFITQMFTKKVLIHSMLMKKTRICVAT